MKNKKKYNCPHCEEEFTLIWEQDDLEPISCVFCGGALDNGDEEELLEEQEDDEDNWN